MGGFPGIPGGHRGPIGLVMEEQAMVLRRLLVHLEHKEAQEDPEDGLAEEFSVSLSPRPLSLNRVVVLPF